MANPGQDIVPRDLRFGLVENADRAWFGGDLFMSVVVDAFAIMLPEGERFFIRSLKHYAPDITDEAVLQGIRGYAIQEAFHTREHESYNDALRKLGYDVDAMEDRSRRLLENGAGPLVQLLSTCAIEQLTYSLARFILGRPELMERAAPAYRRLWRWHALEELEHSAVALQVLRAARTGLPAPLRYVARAIVLNIVFARLIRVAIANMATMLRTAQGRMGLRDWLRLGWILFGAPGFVRGLVGPYFAYLRPGYLAGGSAADARLVALGRRLMESDPPPAAVRA